MNTYSQYNEELSFRVFRNHLMEAIKEHLHKYHTEDHFDVVVSPYLEVGVVEHHPTTSQEHGTYYPLNEIVKNGEILTDQVDELAYKHIILPLGQLPTKTDVLNDCMMQAHLEGKFPEVLNPYFSWKMGNITCEDITKEQLFVMAEKVSEQIEGYEDKHPAAHNVHDCFVVDDPWQFTRGFGEDKYMMAYLLHIEGDLENIRQRIW